MNNAKNIAAFVGIFALLLAILLPFIFIWSINTLFSLNIVYGFWEWLAAFCLTSFMSVRHINSFKNNS
jgi:fatty acid desaturase